MVRLLEDYRQYVDPQAKLALFGGWTGLDLSGVDLAGPLKNVRSEGHRSALETFTSLDSAREWTTREVANFIGIGIGGRGPVIVGSPETIADELQRWMTEADVDGFNLSSVIRPRRRAGLCAPGVAGAAAARRAGRAGGGAELQGSGVGGR